ncbi:flavin reductase [Pseudonocardiaceae bacterium YIM PH 21723]|nr:flavin reductase [Pseudonocardiaceae bacterium YIM PH 21723]
MTVALQDGFRSVFRRHPAGVVVITLDGGDGPAGFTATSLSSLSLEPPLVSFGIGSGASCWPHVRDARHAVVNFLAHDQELVARRFATSGIDRFAGTSWSRLSTGEPVLDGVASWLRVRIESLVPAGDHRLVVAAVQETHSDADARPLLYHDGTYHTL